MQEIDPDEIQQFLTWKPIASTDTRKKKQKWAKPKPKPKLERKQEEKVVCRVCEKPIRKDLLEKHTQACVWLVSNETRLKNINDNLEKVKPEIFRLISNGVKVLSRFQEAVDEGTAVV